MSKEKTVYIDADIFVYSVGFAGQEIAYVIEEAVGHSLYVPLTYSTMKSAKASPAYQVDNVTISVTACAVENVLHSMKLQIENVVKATKATDYVVYLTGEGNFRDLVTDDYKATRSPSTRPIHYEELRKYLINNHNAIVIDGCEADDAIGLAATMCPHDCCIASIDKDLNTIRGEHYNWQKDCLYNVSAADAKLWFWCQMIMGDPTDNIKGIPKKGKMAAYKLLEDIQDSNTDMFGAITEEYIKCYNNDHNKGIAMRDMNAKLLWILNNDEDLWDAHNPTATEISMDDGIPF